MKQDSRITVRCIDAIEAANEEPGFGYDYGFLKRPSRVDYDEQFGDIRGMEEFSIELIG